MPDVMTCSSCFLSSQRVRVCFLSLKVPVATLQRRKIEDSPCSRACRLSRIIERRSRIARFVQNSRVFRSLMTTMMTQRSGKRRIAFPTATAFPTDVAARTTFFSRTGRQRNGRASLSISRTNTPSYRMLQLLVPCGLAISFGRFVRLSCTFSTAFRSDVCASGGGKTRITSENKKESC